MFQISAIYICTWVELIRANSILSSFLSQTYFNVFDFLDPCFLRIKVAVLCAHTFIEPDEYIIRSYSTAEDIRPSEYPQGVADATSDFASIHDLLHAPSLGKRGRKHLFTLIDLSTLILSC